MLNRLLLLTIGMGAGVLVLHGYPWERHDDCPAYAAIGEYEEVVRSCAPLRGSRTNLWRSRPFEAEGVEELDADSSEVRHPIGVTLTERGRLGLTNATAVSVDDDRFVCEVGTGEPSPYAVIVLRSHVPKTVEFLEFTARFSPRSHRDLTSRFFWLEEQEAEQGEWFTREHSTRFELRKEAEAQRVRIGVQELAGSRLRAIRFDLPPGVGRFELGAIKWVSRSNPLADFVVEADHEILGYRFGNVTRPGVVVRGRSRLVYYVELLEAPVDLQFSWATLPRRGGSKSGATASVFVNGEPLFVRSLDSGGSRWIDVSLPLAGIEPVPDGPMEIEFVTRGGDEQPTLVWGVPRLARRAEAMPAVLLVTLDTTRVEHVSVYDSIRDTTPNLKRESMDPRSVVYLNHRSQSNVTTPSHASLLTGLYPPQLGVVANDTWEGHAPVLRNRYLTLAEVFRDAGYATGAFVSAAPLSPELGFAQGFDVFDAPMASPDRRGDETVLRALEWLQDHVGRPVFLWLHLFDPHSPYDDAPLPIRDRFLEVGGSDASDSFDMTKRWYDSSIYFADLIVSGVTAKLRREWSDEQFLSIVTSDHGESFGEHGIPGDHFGLYHSNLAIPLVVHFPSHAAGRIRQHRSEAPTENVDIVPTVLEISSLPVPEGLPGRHLLAEPSGDRATLAWWQSAASIAQGGMRLLVRRSAHVKSYRNGQFLVEFPPGIELYDLVRDPREENDLAAERPEMARILLERIERATELATHSASKPEETQVIPKSHVDRLRALGYVE